MARIASHTTIKKNKSIRTTYAMRALERDSLGDDPETSKKADAIMLNFQALTFKEQFDWADREIEFRQLNE